MQHHVIVTYNRPTIQPVIGDTFAVVTNMVTVQLKVHVLQTLHGVNLVDKGKCHRDFPPCTLMSSCGIDSYLGQICQLCLALM